MGEEEAGDLEIDQKQKSIKINPLLWVCKAELTEHRPGGMGKRRQEFEKTEKVIKT
jgi:hypothetical protein